MRRVRGLLRISLSYNILLLFSTDASIYVSFSPSYVVTALRDDIRRRQQVVQHIASLEEQLDSDRICGAWLAAEGTLTASLRRIGTATYRMLVYDHTLCYRRLVQDAVVTLRHHRLLFGEEEDCGANRVEYDPATDRLTLGCYGLFLPDDATHPAAEEFETPVE